jgi:A/G-specific adenine glycosylase
MDLGAGVCARTRPQCTACPLQQICVARQDDRVAVLPTPRPRKAVPEKSTRMLILYRRGEVFLEKRPAPGIWGGLWSFPEAEPAQDPAGICRSRFGAEVETDRVLPDVRHGFTHFTLTITPVLLRVAQLEPRAGAPGGIWLNLEDAAGAALPAPVRRILQQLQLRATGSGRA